MSHSKWVIEVAEANFQQEVLVRSTTTPVLVDFWAPWCGPCRTLGPILEKLAEEMRGRFVLAKINSDKNQTLAQTYKVRGIPSVKLFLDGKLTDEFTGALPESAIRKFLDRALPSAADRCAALGQQLEDQGQLEQATAQYQTALSLDTTHSKSLLGLTRIWINSQRMDEAKATLARLSNQDAESPEAKSLRAKLTFANSSADLNRLQAVVAENPGDHEARLALGQALVGAEMYAEAMDQFLESLRRDKLFQDGAARKAVLDVFDLLGPTHPLVMPYRSKLSTLLFA